MNHKQVRALLFSLAIAALSPHGASSAATFEDVGLVCALPVLATQAGEKVIIDTDIGTDIDDAFALALALRSPELRVLAVTTASGDPAARALIVERMLEDSNCKDIPVGVGIPTTLPNGLPPIGLQSRFGERVRWAPGRHAVAADLLAEQIRKYPGQISLVAIGPLTNLGTLIAKEPLTFRKLKRVIMIGGWFQQLDFGEGQKVGPAPEYNVLGDIPAAREVLQSGVPITVITLDATYRLFLDEVKRHHLFIQGTPLTDSLALLYNMWGGVTPVLFDTMAIAFAFDPMQCPVEPMHVVVDDAGITRDVGGVPNAEVCLRSDPNAFMDFYIRRMAPK